MLHHITTAHGLVASFHSVSDEDLEFQNNTGYEVPIFGFGATSLDFLISKISTDQESL